MHMPMRSEWGYKQNRIRYERSTMTIHSNPDAEAATQYLIWALEEIEKTGDQEAAYHARLALKALRKDTPRSSDMAAS
jgi:hypothetical protein